MSSSNYRRDREGRFAETVPSGKASVPSTQPEAADVVRLREQYLSEQKRQAQAKVEASRLPDHEVARAANAYAQRRSVISAFERYSRLDD